MYEFKCSLNKEGCLLDLKFENEVKKHKKPLLKIYQKNAYTSQQFTYSNDEKLILGIEKSEIYIYHIKSQQKDFIFNGVDELRVAEFFPGNSGVLFNRKDLLSLQYIDLKSDTARVFVGHENVVDAISVSPKGNKFASIDRGGVILFCDLEIGLEFKFQLQKEDVLFRYEDSLTIEFSPNGKQLAVKAAGSLYFITIDDIPNNKKLIHTFDNNANSLSGLKIEGMDIGRGKVLSKKMYEGLWSKYHHIYWKNKAEQNDPEALLQLGIVAQRDKKWDMAKLYYKKAKQAGHKNADYRFKINELMRKEYSSVLVK
jgi:WD40 repeat protein